MKRVKIILTLNIFIFSLFSFAYSDSQDCLIAKDIAAKAYELSNKDKKKSLILFIKAKNLCKKPEYDFNLSIAYWKYGVPNKAIDYMNKAVNKKKNPTWLNNLSMMFVSSEKDPLKALEYANKAYSLDPESPMIAETRIKANLYADKNLEALKLSIKFSKSFPDNEKLELTKKFVTDKYLTKYLTYIKNKEYQTGINGLKRASDLIPGAAKALSLSLLKVNQYNEAINAAKKAELKFLNSEEVEGLFNSIVKQTIKDFYVKFQEGEEERALSMAKQLSKDYPSLKIAKKTYNDFFDAYLNSVEITIPPTVKTLKREKIKTDSDALMASVFGDNKATDYSDLIPDIEKNIPETGIRNPHGVAVIIGNRRYEKYKKGIKDVIYAERDAALMKKYLIKTLGFKEENIIYYLNTTSGELRDIFGTLQNRKGKLSRYLRENLSDVFIYYSGHGAPGPKGESAYLVPVDASPDFIANNGYPLNLFYQQVENLPAKSITIVIESCFSGDSAAGTLFTNISPAMVKNISPVQNVKNASVLCSADKNQVATWYRDKRHGLFTYFFLKGLSGIADTNKDKKITLKEMASYLDYEVPHWAGRKSNRTQTPVVRGKMDKVLVVFDK